MSPDAPSEAPQAERVRELRALRAAFVFLTRIAVGGFPYSGAEWKRAPGYFPIVGFAVGALAAGVATATVSAAGPLVAGILAVLAGIVATGAFHEDGLADTADALGGPAGPDRVAEILKDPRVGTFGATALAASLLLRSALVAALLVDPGRAAVAIVLAHGGARAGAVWLMVSLPYVTDAERARSRGVTQAGPAQVRVAAVSSFAALGVAIACGSIGWWAGAAALAALAAALLACRSWFARRAHGLHGDFLGAAEQVGEVVVLLALLLAR